MGKGPELYLKNLLWACLLTLLGCEVGPEKCAVDGQTKVESVCVEHNFAMVGCKRREAREFFCSQGSWLRATERAAAETAHEDR
jgi:uncharacterized lipoprotein NlpE involved in copper resistance